MTYKEGDKRLMRHGGWISTMKVEEIPLDAIVVTEDRRRKTFKNVDRLAFSFRRIGQLEPIMVDKAEGQFRLVFGERRLRAATQLGWKTIAAIFRDQLTDEEYREIELEENANREDLLPEETAIQYSTSKRRVEKAKVAGEILSAQSTDKPLPRGNQPVYGVAKDVVANAIGISEPALRKAEQHVNTAERFPFMQGSDWRQSQVLAVRERMEDIDEQEQLRIAGVLECARILHPADAITMVDNMVAMKPAERQELFKLSESNDPRDHSLALTKAMQQPPNPDPRLHSVQSAIESLGRASKPFPNDPLTPRIESAIVELRAIYAAVKAVSYDARRNGAAGGTVQ